MIRHWSCLSFRRVAPSAGEQRQEVQRRPGRLAAVLQHGLAVPTIRVYTSRREFSSNRAADASRQLLAQIGCVLPRNVISLSDVEVRLCDVIFAASVDHLQPETIRKSRFVVDVLLVVGEVGHDETTLAYFGYDLVVNVGVKLLFPN